MADLMLLLVDVKSGDVLDVFEIDEGMVNKNVSPVEIHCKKTDDIKTPFNIKGFQSDKAIGTFYAQESPGCRYVHIRGCTYRRVCR